MTEPIGLDWGQRRAFRAGEREARRLSAAHRTLTYEGEITWPRAEAARVAVRVHRRTELWQRGSARYFAAWHRRTLAHAAAVAARHRAEAALAEAGTALAATGTALAGAGAALSGAGAALAEAGGGAAEEAFLPAVDHRLSHAWHLALLVAITVLEWPLVYMMLQLLSIGQLLTAMSAASLAVATVAVCDHLGALLRRRRIPAGFWPLAAALLAYLVAGAYLRAVYVQVAGDAPGLSVTAVFLTFLSIEVLLAACAVYLGQRVAAPAEEQLRRARRGLQAALRRELRAAGALARAEQRGRLQAQALQQRLLAQVAAGRVYIDAYWRGLAAGWPAGVPFPTRAFYQPALPSIPLLWPPELATAIPAAASVAAPAGAAAAAPAAPAGPAWLPDPAIAPVHGDD